MSLKEDYIKTTGVHSSPLNLKELRGKNTALGTGIGGERDAATCFAHAQRGDSKDKNTGDTRTVYLHSQDHLFMFSILCFILKII